ncbi:MAG: site-specific DNA-methyltransferase, partial [Actinomycetota bacterium]
YVRRVSLRGRKEAAKLEGEGYTLGEQIQYTDIWANDNYLQFMYERLLLLKELLHPAGTIYLHLDANRSSPLRLVLDEVFGPEHFRNELIWQRTTAHSDTRGRFGEIHDVIYAYAKGDSPTWTSLHIPYSDAYRESKYYLEEPDTGRRYRLGDLTAPGPRPNLEYEWDGIRPPPGRCWAVPRERMEEYGREGRLIYSRSGMPQYKRYLDEMAGLPVQDVWTDIPPVNPMAAEKADYPTQKPEGLLRRIISASSAPSAVVLDCFAGSGTTAVVAQRMGRRWIGCDINKGAIQTTAKRLQDLIQDQMAEAERASKKKAQEKLVDGEEEDRPGPAQLAFTTWRVNDYDLAIQHNEAVNLACEHIGVERTRTDPYFDGTLGKSLVKVVPFQHPLSPVDLEELKRELDARLDEDRGVTLVCLGMELSAQSWIEDWNRLRRGANAVNRIEVIELRSDERYGKFIKHEPSSARVDVSRKNGRITIRIEDFVSPSIVERLSEQTGVVQPRIEDWRSMVDSVMIDPSFDGDIFNVGLSDVPEKKADLVEGSYELEAPDGETTVAVKITDMLGEEVLITEAV